MTEDEIKKEIQSIIYTAMHESFNRSISALEDAGALNTENMREHYSGVGSAHYDLVTKQMDYTAEQLNNSVSDLVSKIMGDQH